ncbi:hypothetical protein [Cohnella soli]|uniref:Amidase n=1 Tax=Cohnella soli TaxID=425005 RepID=A0ABW0HLY8_9BACL
MKKLFPSICFVVMLLLNLMSATTAKGADVTYSYQNETKLSTWLWDASKIVDSPDKVIEDLADRHVKFLLLQIDFSVDVEYYRKFIGKATFNGIKVEALDGAPQWVTDGGEELQQNMLDWLVRYQNTSVSKERFQGVHLDVEPYENEHYEEHMDEYIGNYQLMIEKFKMQTSKLKLEFGIDIPFWFYGVKYDNQYGSGNLAEWLCHYVKKMTIMAYRDSVEGENGIISVAAAEMKLFEKYKVRGTIAVETGKVADAYQFITFYGKGKEVMNRQLQRLYEYHRKHSAFDGIAIHYYDSWVAMK